MYLFEFTYNEPGVINKKETIKASSINEALTIFETTHPNAVFEKTIIVTVND